jgi:hypothetical protein
MLFEQKSNGKIHESSTFQHSAPGEVLCQITIAFILLSHLTTKIKYSICNKVLFWLKASKDKESAYIRLERCFPLESLLQPPGRIRQ